MTKEEVDALYDEFKMEAEAFNARVRGQNRLLCLGFGYDTDDADTPQFPSITPYELFCNPEYSSYDVASLFYDFGPKWYLQIAEDGSVTAPFNSNRMYPLQAWTDNIYYLAAFNSQSLYPGRCGDVPQRNISQLHMGLPGRQTDQFRTDPHKRLDRKRRLCTCLQRQSQHCQDSVRQRSLPET